MFRTKGTRACACTTHTFYSTTVLKHTRKVKLQRKTWAIIRVFTMLDVVAVAITVGFLCFLVLVNCASETSSSLLPSRESQAPITSTQPTFTVMAAVYNILVSSTGGNQNHHL